MIVFVHIERSAGSSITTSFSEVMEGRWFSASGIAEISNSRAACLAVPGRDIYVAGHFSLPALDAVLPPAPGDLVFSVLRDPVDRMVSLYYLMKRSPDWLPHLASPVGDGDLASFYDFCHAHGYYAGNRQCERLGGAATFASAVAAIEERYALVGVHDRLTPFLDRLALRVADRVPGWTYLGPENAAPRPDVTVDRRLAARIRGDASDDCALVEWVSRDCGGLFEADTRP